MKRAWLLVALSACMGANGHFRGEDGPSGAWSLRPNRCQTANGARYIGYDAGLGLALDLYYAGPDADDTEVVGRPAGATPSVLVRIPGQRKMVVLRQADCAVLDVALRDTLYSVNDATGMAGHVTLDCRRPEIGHVIGTATFECF